MVRKTIEAVAQRFSRKSKKVPEKVPERRLLVVIRAVDGDLVLQKKQEDHQPRHHYKAEARTLMQSLFPTKPEKFCARSRADDAFHQVVNFKRTSDIVVGRHFERDGIEWHPVLFEVAFLGFDMEFFRNRAKKYAGMKTRTLRKLSEHEYAEKLLERFPRN